mgnify:CR=1 FL=1
MKKTSRYRKKRLNKWKIALAGGIVAAIAIIVVVIVVIQRKESMPKPVIAVNGSPVYEEEYDLLFKDNQLKYEGELYEQLQVPEGQELITYLDNDEKRYQELLTERHIQALTELRVQQALAKEYGVLEKSFSYENLKREMEQENEERKKKIAAGEVVYGVTEFDMVTYYGHFMSSLAADTLRAIPDEVLEVAEDKVEDYYQSKTSPVLLEGERQKYTIYDVGSLMVATEEERDSILAEVQAELASGQDRNVDRDIYSLRAEQVQWGNDELRTLVRQGSDVEARLLALEAGEVSEMFYTGETWLVARYDGVEKVASLGEGERSILLEEMRQEAYQKLVEKLVSEAKVKRY